MTTFAVPPTGSPAWREIYPTPPDVRLDLGAGVWCPIDDTTLQIRLDGYGCPRCRAAWDFRGLSGRWLAEVASAEVAPSVRWRPSPATVAAGIAGCALVAAGLVVVLTQLDERLVWWLSAVIGAAAVLIVAGAWLAGQFENRRYRHNTVRPIDVDGEVRDEH
jgi:hypothetical protein